MGKGLPKKYAKMGFKKGWAAYKAKKRSTKRKSGNPSPKKRRKTSSRRYAKRSNPSSGAKSMKIGGALQKLKLILNMGAPAIGAAKYPTLGTTKAQIENAVARYTGYHPAFGNWSTDYCGDAWQGIGTTLLLNYADRKTRHFGNISRMKLLDIAEEAVPIFMAYDQGGSITNMVTNYNQASTGYNSATLYGNWDFQFVKPYATMKAVRIGLDMFGVRKWINRKLPKGINL